jgi:hypothetical protein
MNKTEATYYLGGYYLTKLKPKSYGTDKESLIYTCSACINDHLLDTWSYSWTTDNNKQLDEIRSNYQLSDNQINEVRKWVDNRFDNNKIGFLNLFTDLETALDYKNRFFSHLSDIKIFSLYFDANERADIIKEFKPQSEKMGEMGLRLILRQEIPEQANETLLGYDYIGIEMGGSFHTFHCHDVSQELSDKFNLTITKYGLFDSATNSRQVLDYLNNEENGCEPVPWFIAKVKLVANDLENKIKDK